MMNDVVEADVERAGLDLAVPVGVAGRAEAEVPLADDAGRVAGALQHRRQRRPAGLDDQRRVAGRTPVPGFRQAYSPVSIA